MKVSMPKKQLKKEEAMQEYLLVDGYNVNFRMGRAERTGESQY